MDWLPGASAVELLVVCQFHYLNNTPMQYHAIFMAVKVEDFQMKKSIISIIFAQNKFWVLVGVPTIYVLEQKIKIMYTPCKPQIYNMKVELKGVYRHYPKFSDI